MRVIARIEIEYEPGAPLVDIMRTVVHFESAEACNLTNRDRELLIPTLACAVRVLLQARIDLKHEQSRLEHLFEETLTLHQ